MTDDPEPLEICRPVIYGSLLPFHLVYTIPHQRGEVSGHALQLGTSHLSILFLEQQQVGSI